MMEINFILQKVRWSFVGAQSDISFAPESIEISQQALIDLVSRTVIHKFG